jgi:hypothetical protein
MPVIVAFLWNAFLAILPSLVGRVLLSLGMSVATYTGVQVTFGWLKDQAVARFVSLPPDLLGLLATLKVGESLSIIFSALVVRASLAGLTSGTFKRWVTK